MSHIRKCTLDIKNANAAILKQAVEMIAKDMGFQTIDRVANHAGMNQQSVLIGIKGDGCRGMGVRITDGKIEVVGDDWNQKVKLEEFQTRVNQAYKAVSYQAQLVKQGYSTTVSYQAQQKRYVLAGAKA